jgi:hypothetical protein
MSGVIDVLVVGALAVLFLVSVAQQVFSGRWIKKIKDRDVMALIPIWSFFAPNPGRTDYHLLFRDQLVTGEWCPWHEISQGPRTSLRSVWNPGKRRAKGLTDHISSLMRSLNGVELEPIVMVLHPSYLTLLRWVTIQGSDPRSHSRQFLVAQTSGFGAESTEPEILFISLAHPLREGDDSHPAAQAVSA